MILDYDDQEFKIQGFILIDCVDSHRTEDAKFYKRILKIIKKFGTHSSPIINAAPNLKIDFDDCSIKNTIATYSNDGEPHRMMRRGLEKNQGVLKTPDSLRLRMNNEYCVAFVHCTEFFYYVGNHLANKITNWLVLGRTWNMCVHENSIGLHNLSKFAPGFGLNFYAIDGGFQKSDLTIVTREDFENDPLEWIETTNSMYKLKLNKTIGLAGYPNSANDWVTIDPRTVSWRLE